VTCAHCRKKFEVLHDEIFITPQGDEVRVESSCDDCLRILRERIEAYICASTN